MFMAVTGWRKGSFIYKQSAYKNLLRSYKAAGALSWLYTYFFSHDFVMRGNFILFMQLVDSIRGTTQGTCLTVQMSNDKAKKNVGRDLSHAMTIFTFEFIVFYTFRSSK